MFAVCFSYVTSVVRPWGAPDGAGHVSKDCYSRSVSDSWSVAASVGAGSLKRKKVSHEHQNI